MSLQPNGGLGRGLGALFPNMPGSDNVDDQTTKKDNVNKKSDFSKGPVNVNNDSGNRPKKNDEPIKMRKKTLLNDDRDSIGGVVIQLKYISPSIIVANPHQPRRSFDEKALNDLTESIREHGIMQPLVVTKVTGGKFELIAGERRLRASRNLDLDVVPVLVRNASEQEKLELALIENIQRAELNAVEEARAYEAMSDLFNLTQAEIADRVGKSRSNIANIMRLLDLDQNILDALMIGKISRTHARTLLSELNREKRQDLFKKMVAGEMTVREAEARSGAKRRGRRVADMRDPNIIAMESELRSVLGTKVKLNAQGGSGKMEIYFYSKEELKEIIDKLIK